MALGGTARPLLVPAADVLAKNMRAVESARAASSSSPQQSGTEITSPSFLMGLGAATEENARDTQQAVRFRRAEADPTPNPITAFFARIFSSSKKDDSDTSPEADSRVQKALRKILPPLEKAAAIASRLPDPTVLFLALVLAVLLVDRHRPHWFDPILVRIAAVASFLPLFALALLWRKTELFAQLREGQNPLTHPAEHRLDGLEAELKEREEKLRQAQETLKKNRAQLDALRKELAKDPNATNPEAVIVPSRKAAEMIAAGALGAGYDEEASQAVEARRKEESVKRSREEWRLRNVETENSKEQTNESLKLMADHAATAYTKRTREIKTRSAAGATKASERLMGLKKVVSVGKKEEEADPRRTSRQSERSVASTATSTASRKRIVLFRRKRRGTGVTRGTEEGLTPPPSDSRIEADIVQV